MTNRCLCSLLTRVSYSGFFMRTYGRNVRRAWDGDDYRAPKRQRLDHGKPINAYPLYASANNENSVHAYDLEDNLERAIRETSVAALSSSPSRKNSTIFSSTESQEEHEPSTTITPPSSPPPVLQITPPNVKVRKSTFSTFDKKKHKEKEKLKTMMQRHDKPPDGQTAQNGCDTTEPLTELVNSSTRVGGSTFSSTAEMGANLPPKLSKQLTQTVLDFGQSMIPTTCAQCQMSYTPSVPEDTQLHDMYHNRHSQGIELGKAFLKSAMKWCYEVPHIPGSVVVVDRKISLPGRRVVQRVLEVVNKELGSIDIPETELWSQKSLDGDEAEESTRKADRYKVFLHVLDGKCVGVCLAERISHAYRVKRISTDPDKTPTKDDTTPPLNTEPKADDGSSSLPTPTSASPNLSAVTSPADIELEETPSPAIVGVSRIWTSRTQRRKGIANNLLECVMNQFIYGMEIKSNEVAFSTPTELGTALAKGWYGEAGGWSVYRE